MFEDGNLISNGEPLNVFSKNFENFFLLDCKN